MTTKDLIVKVIEWAEDRNLVSTDKVSQRAQYLKTLEELGELAEGINKADMDLIKDAIGDVLVCLIILSEDMGCDSTSDTMSVVLDCGGTDMWCNFHPMVSLLTLLAELGDEVFYDGDVRTGYIELEDTFGIMCTTLARLCTPFGLNVVDCLEHAYDQIKDRKGIMYNRVFIKESDPRFEEIRDKVLNEKINNT